MILFYVICSVLKIIFLFIYIEDQQTYRQQVNNPSGAGGGMGGGTGGGAERPPIRGTGYRSDVTDTQIALALVRLQQDMSSVLNRLNTLEALTLAQHNNGSVSMIIDQVLIVEAGCRNYQLCTHYLCIILFLTFS